MLKVYLLVYLITTVFKGLFNLNLKIVYQYYK